MHPHLRFGSYILCFLALGYLALYYLTDLLLPFIIALTLAYLIEPAVQLLQKKAKFNRNMAVVTAILVVISLISMLITFLVLKLYSEVVSLSSVLPHYYNKFNVEIMDSLSKLESLYLQLPPPAVEIIQNNISKIYNVFDSLLRAFLVPLTALPSFITILIISAVATYFISKDREIIYRFCWGLLPKNWQEQTHKTMNEVVLAIINFIKAQAILVSITTCIATVGLFTIGIKYALLIGILAGAFDFLPVIGPSTIFIPWIFYNVLIVANYSLAIKIAIIYLAIMFIRQISEPKIVGQAIGIHPLASLMAMYVGIKLVGVTGIIIGPLTLVTLKALIKTGVIPRLPRE